MSNVFLKGLSDATNFGVTENGAIKHLSTQNDLLDLFALGGAYRTRSDEDMILLFKNALDYNESYALKCLFYLRDIRGGQGERRFFRVCMNWLANEKPEIVKRNFKEIPIYGRWDDLYCFVGTPVEPDVFLFFKEQLAMDLTSLQSSPKTGVSLLGKWLKSCNASSKETKKLGELTRQYFGLSQKEYRKILSSLRDRINIVEKLMSENRWEEIEFDKLPSKAGLIYRNAFAQKDIIKEKYIKFMMDKTSKVNAKALYPYEIVNKVLQKRYSTTPIDDIDRITVNKYWNNIEDFIKGANFNGIAVVDTSGSMLGTPMEVAISLGLYCAERCTGPFANHFITFSAFPQLVKTEGIDFWDKVLRIYRNSIISSTNIEAVFDLLLDTAIKNKCSQEDLPQNILVISDMEFNQGSAVCLDKMETLMETISQRWKNAGYSMPHLIYWNVNARTNNIPQLGKDKISFISGFSPSIFQALLTGKSNLDLMYEILDSERYKMIG